MKYSYNDMMHEFKLFMDSGDKWGSAMGTLFSIASELYCRSPTLVPDRWGYSPGAAEDPREPEDCFYDICINADADDLIRLGNVLERYTRNLDRNGHSY